MNRSFWHGTCFCILKKTLRSRWARGDGRGLWDCLGGRRVFQRTIAEKISCTGIGIHGGAPVELTLHPARANSGIVFIRVDGAHPVEIPARSEAVVSTDHATSLGRGSVTIGTVEHLLAALYGLGIDNVLIEVNGPELPIMDGSAASFVYLIRSAGIYEQDAEKSVLRVRRSVEVRDGAKRIFIEPARSLKITYTVDFAHPSIGRQAVRGLEMVNGTFEAEVARARTFGFFHEVETLRRHGLGRGGSLDNTVVLDDSGVMNPGGLRWPDEFARHKVLDLLGDLALLGVPLEGHIQVERGGHALHQEFVAELLRSPENWQLVSPSISAERLPDLAPPLGHPAEVSA